MRQSQVTTRHFEIFLTMLLSRTMAEAADKLGISMAAISKSLKSLERDTGLTLFRLANGRLVATPEAERLLPFAQRAVDHLDRARQAAAGLQGGDVGQITVGTAGPALVSLMPLAIEQFHAQWPDIRIELQIDNTHKLLDKVAGNEVDIGVGTPMVRDIDGRILQLLDVQDLCETWLVAVLPKRHRLARQATIRPADLAEETMIGLAPDSATTHLISAMFQQAGQSYHPGIVVANAIGVCALVQQGIGIGLMNPLMLAQEIFPGVVSRPFRPRVMLRTCLYFSKLHEPEIGRASCRERVS
jgi:DNA-binding transcriptional LysR family regulator